ncbi:MAG: hypothetical protein R3179_09225, partial [Sedimenticolaceae bacterium]|nr:hypothetical protein [Sedimenticolaceae bacterium]
MNIYRGIVTIVAIGILATVYSNGLVAAPGVVGGSPDYGDIVYLLRDENGVPVPNPQTGCRQPLAFPSNEGCNLECVDPTVPCVVPT